VRSVQGASASPTLVGNEADPSPGLNRLPLRVTLTKMSHLASITLLRMRLSRCGMESRRAVTKWKSAARLDPDRSGTLTPPDLGIFDDRQWGRGACCFTTVSAPFRWRGRVRRRPQQAGGSVDVGGELVVGAAEVLPERVPGTDHWCRAESFQTAHGRSRKPAKPDLGEGT
jgi:hypothetical protein